MTEPTPEVTPQPEDKAAEKPRQSAWDRAHEVMVDELNLTKDHAEKILQKLEVRGILVTHENRKSGIGGL